MILFAPIISGSMSVSGSVNIDGSVAITSSAQNIFLIKNANNHNVLTVSQSGVVVLATQSIELTSPAPVGGIYFTSSSLFIGLE